MSILHLLFDVSKVFTCSCIISLDEVALINSPIQTSLGHEFVSLWQTCICFHSSVYSTQLMSLQQRHLITLNN